MIDHFYQTNEQYRDIRIIPVHSPGYGGTQFEGYFQALYSLVSKVVMNQEANEYINVITAPMTPADTRKLKEAFELFSIPIILLPDVSDNLDGVFSPEYEKLPKEGTPIEEIEKMAGAWLTLELSGVFPSNTPGKYLEETYGVPLIQMNMPVGLEDTDGFYRMLSSISKKGMPSQIKLQRGRYLDAMIDAHKYNGEGRAVIYGEPDYVVSTTRLCLENGVMPLVVATGSACSSLKSILENDISSLAEQYSIHRFEILDEVDFKKIESLAETLHANLLIEAPMEEE